MDTSRKRMRRDRGAISQRHCEPTGRANARPMTGSAKQSILSFCCDMDCFAALVMTLLGCLKTRVGGRAQPHLSCPGLTRASIQLREKHFPKRMDCRVKPGNDGQRKAGDDRCGRDMLRLPSLHRHAGEL